MSITNPLATLHGESFNERLENTKRMWAKFAANKFSLLGSLMMLSVIFIAIFAPIIAPYPEHAGPYQDLNSRLLAPSLEHPFGTDTNGRDVLSRVIFGTRIALLMATVVLTLSATIGVVLGLIAGYLGGVVNNIIMRLADVMLSIPALLLAMAVAALVGPNLWIAMVAISLHWWAAFARLVRGEVISIKNEEFSEASKALGATWYRTTFREVLPNVIAPITVKATLDVGFIILVGAGLAFLGLGTQPPTPDWGVMVARGRQNVLSAWWVSTFPGLAIAYTVLGFNLLGDGLRDMFDVEVEP